MNHDMGWPQALSLLILVLVATFLMVEAIRAQRFGKRKVNRRRPGVLKAPDPACQRNGTEAVTR